MPSEVLAEELNSQGVSLGFEGPCVDGDAPDIYAAAYVCAE
jgi:hypothetical protein